MRGANWSHCFWGRGYDKQGEWGERRKWWRPTLSRLYILLSFKVLIYIASLKQKNIKNSNKPATYRYFLKNRNKLTNTSYGIGKSSTGLTYLTTSTSIHSAPCQQLLGHVIQHRKSLSEFTLYFKKVCDKTLVVSLYVDDLLVTGSNMEQIDNFIKEMKNVFEMTDLRRMTFFLGMEVQQK